MEAKTCNVLWNVHLPMLCRAFFQELAVLKRDMINSLKCSCGCLTLRQSCVQLHETELVSWPFAYQLDLLLDPYVRKFQLVP